MFIGLFLFMSGVLTYIMLKPPALVEKLSVKLEQPTEPMMVQLKVIEARSNA